MLSNKEDNICSCVLYNTKKIDKNLNNMNVTTKVEIISDELNFSVASNSHENNLNINTTPRSLISKENVALLKFNPFSPPVIFAGLSSSFDVSENDSKDCPVNSVVSDDVCSTHGSNTNRSNTESVDLSCGMSNDGDVQDNTFHGSYIPIESTNSNFTSQINELEAALRHSKAREKLLIQSSNKHQENLNETTFRLNELQDIVETLYSENRRIKTSFRELLTATLDSSMNSDSNSFVSTSLTNNILQQKPFFEINSEHENVNTNLIQENNVTCPSNETVTMKESDNDINDDVKHENELLLSLRGTTNYLQKLLQRNSELEQRCSELESGHDQRLRELQDELNNCRKTKYYADADIKKMNLEIESSKFQLGTLHCELRELYEKQQLNRSTNSEIKTLREKVEKLTEELDLQKIEFQQKAALWDKEKVQLSNILAKEKEKTRNDLILSKNESSESLVLRLSELEDILLLQREDSEKQQKYLETDLTTARYKLESLQNELDIKISHIECIEHQIDTLDKDNVYLKNKEKVLNQALQSLQTEYNETIEKLAKYEELETKLQAMTSQNESQSVQITRQLKTIKEENERFAELFERNMVLDRLLQCQQKEKELTLEDSVKSHIQLCDQSSHFQQKLDTANREILILKKQILEHQESKLNIIQENEVNKIREIRHLKELHMQQRKTLVQDFEIEISKLRDQYENELSELRQGRGEKIKSIVNQYEQHIVDLKNVHEQKIKLIQGNKDELVEQLRNENQQRISDIENSFKEKLNQQRIVYEAEISSALDTHQQQLDLKLKSKLEEIDSLQLNLNQTKSDLNYQLSQASKKIEDLELKLETTKNRELMFWNHFSKVNSENNHFDECQKLKDEKDKLDIDVQLITKNYLHEIEELEMSNKILKDRLRELEDEIQRMNSTIAQKQDEEIQLKTQMHEQINELEKQKNDEINALIEKQDILESKMKLLTKSSTPVDQDNSASQQIILELEERLLVSQNTTADLEERYNEEIQLLLNQLNIKEERIQSILTSQQHIDSLLAKNSDLEEAAAAANQSFNALLQEKTESIAQLQKCNVKLQNLLDQVEAQNCNYKTELLEIQNKLTDSEDNTRIIKKFESSLQAKDSKIQNLIETIQSLKKEVEDNKKNTASSDVTQRHLETLKLLANELASAKEENSHLTLKLNNLNHISEEYYRIELENNLLQGRITSLLEALDNVTEKISLKQRLIDELTAQFTYSENQEKSSQYVTADDYRLNELMKNNEILIDEKLNLEQENRSYIHRLDLEKQLLSQCVEQKNRQMKQLIETNKRAETLFIRNAELEELLFKTHNKLDALKQEYLEASYISNNHLQLEKTLLTSKDAGNQHSQFELESLRITCDEKERLVRKLENDIHMMKLAHEKEIESWNSKLRILSLEKTLVPACHEDELLQELIDKTSQLQKEVIRLHKDRDIQGSSTHLDSYRSDSSKKHTGNEARVESLATEKETLRIQVMQMKNRDNESSEVSQMAILQSRNFTLETSIIRLCYIIREQKIAFDILRNQILHKLIKQENNILDTFTKKQMEIQAILEDLKKESALQLNDSSEDIQHDIDDCVSDYTILTNTKFLNNDTNTPRIDDQDNNSSIYITPIIEKEFTHKYIRSDLLETCDTLSSNKGILTQCSDNSDYQYDVSDNKDIKDFNYKENEPTESLSIPELKLMNLSVLGARKRMRRTIA